MKAVRVGSQPVRSRFLSAFFKLSGIEFFMTMTEIIFFQNFVGFVVLGIWEIMPSPLRLCSQWDTRFVEFRECLKSAGIYCESKSSVSYREGSQRVKCCDNRAVAF